MIDATSRQAPWGSARPISTLFKGTAEDAGTTIPGIGHAGLGGDAKSFAAAAAAAGAFWGGDGAAAGGAAHGTSTAKPQVDAAGASGAVVAQLPPKPTTTA
jgi:hypothetical protein